MFGINGNLFWGCFLGVMIVNYAASIYVALANDFGEDKHYYNFIQWNFALNTGIQLVYYVVVFFRVNAKKD